MISDERWGSDAMSWSPLAERRALAAHEIGIALARLCDIGAPGPPGQDLAALGDLRACVDETIARRAAEMLELPGSRWTWAEVGRLLNMSRGRAMAWYGPGGTRR